MHAQTTRKTFGSKLLSMFLATALLVTIFMPMPLGVSAAPPVTPTPVDRYSVVDGRILPASLAGDTSDWVEIAQSGGYSLIVRKVVLPLGKVVFDDRNIDAYQISSVRNLVNGWFKNTLPKTARLRSFSVMSDANTTNGIGYWGVISNPYNSGYSQPTGIKASTGDDVAFLLSFAEAAMFCSNRYALTSTTVADSPALAKKNFNKLTPPGKPAELEDFWWGRTGGHNSGTNKTATSIGTHASPFLSGAVYASSSRAAYPYVRPALWVNSGIFQTWGTVNVTCIDIDTEDVLKFKTFTVPEGPYGPYDAEPIRFYLPGVLSPDSDPIEGSLLGGDVIDIIYLYKRGMGTVTIIHHNIWDDVEITRSFFYAWAGDYGPYPPEDFIGFGDGELLDGSDPPSGELDVDQAITIIYGYHRELVTINVVHVDSFGFEFYREVNYAPVGPYGPYGPLEGLDGEWDPDSDPVQGITHTTGVVLTIRFIYAL